MIAGHHAADLGITGFNLMGGTILDNDGTSPDFSVLFGLATGLTIDTPLTVRSVTTIQSGEESASATVELVVTLSEAVTVATDGGLPTLILSNGATATYDAAASQLSSGKLSFDYIVGPGEGTPDLSALWVTLPSGTTVRDALGNNASFSGIVGSTTGLQVGPAFVSTLQLSPGGAVHAGQTAELVVTVSQGVVVGIGANLPTVTLSNGATAVYDPTSSHPADGVLVFDYVVGASGQTPSLAATAIDLHGTTIVDAHGVGVDLAGMIGRPTGVSVNSPLSVLSIQPSQTGLVTPGTTLGLTFEMSEGMWLGRSGPTGGVPSLILNNGAVATYDAAASDPASGRLAFAYTVAAGQATVGLRVTGVDLGGFVAKDESGYNPDFAAALDAPLAVAVAAAQVSIAALSAVKAEGDSGTFTVSLDHAGVISQTVAWAVTGSGANPPDGLDFAAGALPTGTVTFAAGETSKTITIGVAGDVFVEADEGFAVVLSSPSP
jgi:hypothetical protein